MPFLFLFVIDDVLAVILIKRETYVMHNYFFGPILQFTFFFRGKRICNCTLHESDQTPYFKDGF